MKIAFVTGSLVHGGAERHAITLANRLAERGHECSFTYVKDDSSQLSRLQMDATCLHAKRYLDLAALRALSRSPFPETKKTFRPCRLASSRAAASLAALSVSETTCWRASSA